MDPQLYLAYDGSINSDWVSRYAIHMASTLGNRKITLYHILDGTFAVEKIRSKIAAIEQESRAHGIEFDFEILPLKKNLYATLLDTIPATSDSYCICGARITSRGKGFLAGTISEKLLRSRSFNVLAIRVVHPGTLGRPSDLLFPLAGHPRGFKAAIPFFQMMAPNIQKLHLLRIMQVNSLRFRYLSSAAAKKLRQQGVDYVRLVGDEVQRQIGELSYHIDSHVVVSDDWPKEVLIQANQLKVRMILLGASDRTLPSRFFYGNKLEQILRRASCDVGIYRKI